MTRPGGSHSIVRAVAAIILASILAAPVRAEPPAHGPGRGHGGPDFLARQGRGTQVAALRALAARYEAEDRRRRAEAQAEAARRGWLVEVEMASGAIATLEEVENGRPIYYQSDNQVAAVTSNVDDIHPAGAAGLSLTGAGRTIGIWESNDVRTTHQEFGARVTDGDGATSTSEHATHVAGTLIAAGTVAAAKGMAYAANLRAFNNVSDEAEMATEAAGGLLVSNHSYGLSQGWEQPSGDSWTWHGDTSVSATEDYKFGLYTSLTQQWDEIAWNAPFYLIVHSSGNDRNDTPGPDGGASGHKHTGETVIYTDTHEQDGGGDGFDALDPRGVMKNTLTVGAANDIPGGYTGPSDVVATAFTSYGPTDDGRIKPDLVANGQGLYSSDNDSDGAYVSLSGTSMSAPVVTGAAALLIEHFRNLNPGDTMRATTLKGLLIHTAAEAGAANGPDYRFGWGLLDARAAAAVITADSGGVNGRLLERTLASGATDSFSFASGGTEPIRVTLVWHDTVPASLPPSALNPRNRMLVNDLDLRVSDTSTTYLPWILDVANPSAAAATGDNDTDNVEQVYLATSAAGTYTITITHEGALTGASQDYSLVISGLYLETSPPTSSIGAFFPAGLVLGDSVSAVVADTDQNLSQFAINTISVTATNNRTGETESFTLRENAVSSGYFGGNDTLALSTSSADSASGTGRLYSIAGDTLTIRYVDPDDPSDSVSSGSIPVAAAAAASDFVFASTARVGETLVVALLDADQNLSGLSFETVSITLTNLATGETETRTATETEANAGVFQASLYVSAASADSASGSGAMFASIGDRIRADYTDPTMSSDTATDTTLVVSTFSGAIQQIRVFTEAIGSDTSRAWFLPTGSSGESFPTLSGLTATLTVTDSGLVSGGAPAGRFLSTTAAFSGESVSFTYTKRESARVYIRLAILSDSFPGLAEFASPGESAPLTVMGKADPTTGSAGVLSIPAGYYDTDAYRPMVEPSADFASETPSYAPMILAANAAAAAKGGAVLTLAGVRAEHQVTIRYAPTGTYLHLLDTTITVAIGYPDANDDGFVDGTTFREGTLNLYTLDESLRAWVLVPGATRDAERNFVSARMNHLTVFTLIAVSASADAGGILIYPNPFRPNNADADDGREFVSGDLTTGILMERVPAGSRIRVLNLLGERVFETTVGAGGTYQWDAKNERGRPVASGTYFVLVEAPNGTRRFEGITVIR